MYNKCTDFIIKIKKQFYVDAYIIHRLYNLNVLPQIYLKFKYVII